MMEMGKSGKVFARKQLQQVHLLVFQELSNFTTPSVQLAGVLDKLVLSLKSLRFELNTLLLFFKRFNKSDLNV